MLAQSYIFSIRPVILPKRKHAAFYRRIGSSCNLFFEEVIGHQSDFLVVTLPAILYFVQNVLNFMAASYLDPATLQITAQFKILTTAFFSVIMLGTRLGVLKWCCLFMVLVGVIIVQMQSTTASSKESTNQLFGFICVLLASTTSGFAGVWFEKCLKGKNVPLFLRNIQLSLASIILGSIFGGIYQCLNQVGIMDGDQIVNQGFFCGYTIWTWLSIILMSFGGLLVSVVVKYADSILKVLATTLAFLVATVASIYLFDFKVGTYFVVGSFIVTVGNLTNLMLGSQMYILGAPRLWRLQT